MKDDYSFSNKWMPNSTCRTIIFHSKCQSSAHSCKIPHYIIFLLNLNHLKWFKKHQITLIERCLGWNLKEVQCVAEEERWVRRVRFHSGGLWEKHTSSYSSNSNQFQSRGGRNFYTSGSRKKNKYPEVEREEITSLREKEVEEKNSGFQLANKKSKAINHVREPSFLAAPTRQQ